MSRPPGAPRPKRPCPALWFLLPAVALVSLFYVYPAVETVRLSFYEWNLLSSRRAFVALDNYLALFSDPRFLHAYRNALIWIILFPLLSAACGLFLALLLEDMAQAGGWLRTAFILPLTVSYTAGGLLWVYLYNPEFGALGALLRALGLKNPGWLSDPHLVNVSLILSAVWLWSGFAFLVFRAGLATIPGELIEAAQLDGASWGRRLLHVILPLLKGPAAVVLGMSLLYALKVFDLVFAMTRGGPGTASEVPALLLWRQAFEFGEGGKATANAVLLSLLALGTAWLAARLFSEEGRRAT